MPNKQEHLNLNVTKKTKLPTIEMPVGMDVSKALDALPPLCLSFLSPQWLFAPLPKAPVCVLPLLRVGLHLTQRLIS